MPKASKETKRRYCQRAKQSKGDELSKNPGHYSGGDREPYPHIWLMELPFRTQSVLLFLGAFCLDCNFDGWVSDGTDLWMEFNNEFRTARFCNFSCIAFLPLYQHHLHLRFANKIGIRFIFGMRKKHNQNKNRNRNQNQQGSETGEK